MSDRPSACTSHSSLDLAFAGRLADRLRGKESTCGVVEEAFGVDVGQAKAVAFIERHNRKLEAARGVSSER